MTKVRKIKAVFADGTEKTRGSKDRVYTHAWRYIATSASASRVEQFGFSTSTTKARQNAEKEAAWTRSKKTKFNWTVAIEVVEVQAL